MKVSIIIPVYKVEDYIERCVESVLTQTYSDMEIILVDDASPDNSIERAKQVIDSHPEFNGEIMYVTHRDNRGLSAARNSGIDVAAGDYIYFLDSDDELFDSDSIALLVDAAKETNADIVAGNHYVQRNPNPYHAKYSTANLLEGNSLIASFVKGDVPVTAWNKLIRRSAFDNGLRFKEGILNEDELFSYNILFSKPSVYLLGKTTYRYNYREGSIMTSFNVKRLESPIIVYEEASRSYVDMKEDNPMILQNLDHFAFKRYVDIWKSPADGHTKRNLYHRLRIAQKKMKGIGKMRYIFNSHIYLPESTGYAMMCIIARYYAKSRNL